MDHFARCSSHQESASNNNPVTLKIQKVIIKGQIHILMLSVLNTLSLEQLISTILRIKFQREIIKVQRSFKKCLKSYNLSQLIDFRDQTKVTIIVNTRSKRSSRMLQEQITLSIHLFQWRKLLSFQISAMMLFHPLKSQQ